MENFSVKTHAKEHQIKKTLYPLDTLTVFPNSKLSFNATKILKLILIFD